MLGHLIQKKSEVRIIRCHVHCYKVDCSSLLLLCTICNALLYRQEITDEVNLCIGQTTRLLRDLSVRFQDNYFKIKTKYLLFLRFKINGRSFQSFKTLWGEEHEIPNIFGEFTFGRKGNCLHTLILAVSTSP